MESEPTIHVVLVYPVQGLKPFGVSDTIQSRLCARLPPQYIVIPTIDLNVSFGFKKVLVSTSSARMTKKNKKPAVCQKGSTLEVLRTPMAGNKGFDLKAGMLSFSGFLKCAIAYRLVIASPNDVGRSVSYNYKSVKMNNSSKGYTGN